MNDLSSPDGLNFEPRAIEPESALVPGMAAPQASKEGRTEAFGVTPLSMPPTGGPGPTALQEPGTWVYDFNPATGSSRATYLGEVIATSITAPGSGVASFNTRTGAVVLTAGDVTGVGGLVNPSPGLAGSPTAPTAAPGTSTTQIATTAFVAQAIVANPIVQSFNGRTGAVALTAGDVTNAGGAPVSSPALTGTPTTPTAMQGDQSGKIASTQFVANAIASGTVTSWNGRQGAVNLTLSDVLSVGGAGIASPNFTGVPSGPTATAGTATTQLATTAFVTNAVVAGASGVASFNTRTGAVTLQLADVTSVGGAPILSANLTGTPTAPTPTAGDSSTKLATTAFVGTAIASLPSGVTTFNGRSGTVTLQLTDVTSIGGAPLASPTLTGTPKSVTPVPADNSTNIATTAFVQAALPTVPAAASTTPIMDGTAAVGTATTWARADHVHPTDTSRYAANNPAGYQTAAQVTTSLGSYLPLTGGTLTGALMAGAAVTATGSLVVTNAASTYRAVIGQTGAANRWFIALGDNSPEGGGNTGSNFNVARCNDAGTTIDFPFSINRTSGQAQFGQGLLVGGAGPTQGINYTTQGNHFIAYNWTGTALQAIVDGTVAGTISMTSDYRTKKGVNNLGTMWETVKQLRPVRYTQAAYKMFAADDKERWGFVAHELQNAMIEDAATGTKDAQDLIQSPNPWTIIAALTRALQEAMGRIEALEATSLVRVPRSVPP